MPDSTVATRALNELTARLIKDVGTELPTLGSFGAEIVALEGLAAGLIVSAAVRYNRQPDEAADAFCEGMKARLTGLIYGRQQ